MCELRTIQLLGNTVSICELRLSSESSVRLCRVNLLLYTNHSKILMCSFAIVHDAVVKNNLHGFLHYFIVLAEYTNLRKSP